MTFDYQCRKCKNVWEEFTLHKEKPKCSKCGSLDAKKLMSAPVFHYGIISDEYLRENEVI